MGLLTVLFFEAHCWNGKNNTCMFQMSNHTWDPEFLRFFGQCTVSPCIKWPCYGFKSLMYNGYHIFHVNDPVHTQKDAVKALRTPSRRAEHTMVLCYIRKVRNVAYYIHGTQKCHVVCYICYTENVVYVVCYIQTSSLLYIENETCNWLHTTYSKACIDRIDWLIDSYHLLCFCNFLPVANCIPRCGKPHFWIRWICNIPSTFLGVSAERNPVISMMHKNKNH